MATYNTRTYGIWCGIKQRCLNPKNKRYASYGGRGIDVDPRWAASFSAFVEDMGEAPSGMSIDRVDNDKGYWKGNCKWNTDSQQKKNMRSSRFLTSRGKTLILSDWARELGVHEASILARLKKGMSEEEALSTPFIRRNWGSTNVTCVRCGFSWQSRVKKPKLCRNCGMNAHKPAHHTWNKVTKWQSRLTEAE